MSVVLAALALAVAPPSLADQGPPAPLADTALPDPAREAQARALMATLRCLVCQGQSIADSDAALAADLRALVRERIAAGDPPERVRAWLVGRYGAWISYRPPLGGGTAVLWAAPLLFVGLGLWAARGSFRRRR